MTKTFAFRTSLAILTIVLVLFAIIFTIIGRNIRVLLENSVKTETQKNTELASKDLNNVFNIATNDIVFLSELKLFKDFNIDREGNLRKISEIFVTLSQEKKIYSQVRFIDVAGNEVIRIANNGGTVAEIPESGRENVSHRDYFINSNFINEREIYTSSVDLERDGNPSVVLVPHKPVIRYASPVFDSANNRLGFVIINVNADSFLESLEANIQMSDNQNTYVIEEDGMYVFNEDPKKEWGNESNLATGENFSKDFPELLESIKSSDVGVQIRSNLIISHAKIYTHDNVDGRYLTLVQTSPSETLTSPYLNFIYIMIIPTAIIIILLVLSIYIGSKIIMKPINHLREVSSNIAKGNLSLRAHPGRTYFELEELSNSFNLMAENLEGYSKDMEHRIVEKTSELENKVSEIEGTKKAILNIMDDLEIEKEKVEREKDKIDIIIHSIGDAVMVVDRDMRVVLFNQIAADLTGVPVEEAIDKHYNEVVTFQDESTGKVTEEFIKTSIEKGIVTSMPFKTVLKRKDGTFIPVSDSAAPIKNKLGLVVGCVIVFRDVTKEREVDQAKTEFVSLASHQLKTPLSAIRWYTQMILGGDAGKINKEQREFLTEVEYENERMIELVGALLNVSRIELGTFAVEPKPTNILELCDGVIKELKQMIEKKKQKVVTKYAKDIPEMNIDPKLIRIVFQNVLSNAVKYTPDKGSVTVEISKDEKDLKVQVKDTGYGIPKEQQDKIFTKLFRADNVRKVITDGTGLGLYIVKSIIESSKGKIWFESEEGKGTTFYITLPLTGMIQKEGNKELT